MLKNEYSVLTPRSGKPDHKAGEARVLAPISNPDQMVLIYGEYSVLIYGEYSVLIYGEYPRNIVLEHFLIIMFQLSLWSDLL